MTHYAAMSWKYARHWLRRERPSWHRTHDGVWTVKYRGKKKVDYYTVNW